MDTFKFNTLAKEVTDNLDNFELGVAVSKLYDFIWDNYCDWYIELVKPVFMKKMVKIKRLPRRF